MPRQYYCADCGIPLKVTPKALKNKGLVINVVESHYCVDEDDYKDNITDADRPISTPLTQKEDRRVFPHQPTGDRRAKGDLHKPVTSTAPISLINQLRDVEPTLGDDPRETEEGDEMP